MRVAVEEILNSGSLEERTDAAGTTAEVTELELDVA